MTLGLITGKNGGMLNETGYSHQSWERLAIAFEKLCFQEGGENKIRWHLQFQSSIRRGFVEPAALEQAAGVVHEIPEKSAGECSPE